MKKTYLLGGGIAVLTAAVLVGCNGSDDNGTAAVAPVATQSLTITPSLGKILNAKVVARNAKTGAEIGTGDTGNTGIATFNVTKTTDPVVVEVQGKTGLKYFDESKNAEANFGDGQKIRAVIPTLAANANIGVSSLTESAYKTALSKAKSEKDISADIATKSNETVRKAIAPELSSITSAPSLIGLPADLSTLKNDDAGKYALKLAALAKLAPTGDATPALTVMQKLADDIADGEFDGKVGTTAVGVYSKADLSSKLQAHLDAIIKEAKLEGLKFNLNTFNPTFGTTVITITETGNAGGGTGTNGTVCVATATSNLVVNGFPVSQTNKYCYINFPANTVCDSSNSALNGMISNVNVSQAGVTGNVSMTFSSAASCPADTTVKYDYATGQVAVAIQ